MNALQLCRWQFSHKETLYQTFFNQSAILGGKRPYCVFEPSFGGLGATYDVYFRCAVDFLLVLIEHFLLGATTEHEQISTESGDFAPTGSEWF